MDNGPNLAVAKPKKSVNLEGVQIYPNPSSDVFYLTAPSSGDDYSVTVHNVAGQVIYSEKFQTKNNNTKAINLAKQSKGVYFLNVTSSTQKTFNQKIIKQ